MLGAPEFGAPEFGAPEGDIVDIWHVDALPDGVARIYPDGCQDIVWVKYPGRAPYWKCATLDGRMRELHGAGGASLWGARLAPGCHVPGELLRALNPERPEGATRTIAGLCRAGDAMTSYLAEARLAPERGVDGLARRLGVSARSLQRKIKAESGRGPLFWLRLIRLRKALDLARSGVPLAAAAADAGFADQAHFSREAQQFHAAPPKRLLADPAAIEAILAPGL